MISASSTPITINIKAPNEQKFVVSVCLSESVLELKHRITALTQSNFNASSTSTDEIRLIYSGRILKDMELLESYKISEGHTVHMFRRAAKPEITVTTNVTSSASLTVPLTKPNITGANANTASTPSMAQAMLPTAQDPPVVGIGALPNPLANIGIGAEGGGLIKGMESIILSQMMEDPNFAQYMSSMLQNPQVLESMLSMNPALRAIEPEARQMLRSPQFQQIISNPETLCQMAKTSAQPQLGDNSGGNGSGFSRMFDNAWSTNRSVSAKTASSTPVMSPSIARGTTASTLTMTANTAADSGAGGFHSLFNPFTMFGSRIGAANNSNTRQSLESTSDVADSGHLWIQRMSGRPLSQPHSGTRCTKDNRSYACSTSIATPTITQQRQQLLPLSSEVRYQVQLKEMNEMGLWDASKNIRALLASNGNVNRAVELLFLGAI
ncbi:hypothetical protein BX616_004813 [Lobosporangium transversale]|uniref:Ubiquitin-like domain-containing protein n=1 Tax=Lobosporangium transversale TaxID=64571 RepID=A0A1Y2GCN0_9FUNG|nr:hypothetical protein BCR41DRAFT_424957 [Lobosporangium transversale]KAF9897884.1 hypothetical protein BX616_004813 [Lobosporangium transversale]ORZ07043.1 hypothetical protein BCR41DRAFT_424957 [Lobosporangium transversale]|eukprot:XP_021877839.1 hypothetical protein BCR41DRAFT_424957 [Lobosporangium transversale]